MKSNLRTTSCVAAMLLLAADAGAQEAPRTFETRPVRPGVTLIVSHPDGNMLVVQGTSGTLLVDALATSMVERTDSVVRAVAGGPPRWVVNTHYHDDHIGANARFAEAGAETIAHRQVPVLAKRDTTIDDLRWDLNPANPAALPHTLVDDSLRVDLGGESALLIHLPHAHTGGDLIIKLERANVLHTGDIVEFGAYPFIDWWAGGSFDGARAAVDRILSICDAATILVPGHGPALTREDVVGYRDMLTSVGARVRQAVSEGKTLEALYEEGVTAAWDERHGGERHGRRFVRLLYLEFTKSKQSR
jgi:glyoxylase-like metal-dependent hydrolase (beta-lactamase superfamily II)